MSSSERKPTFIPHPASGHNYNNYASELVLRAKINERRLGDLSTTQGKIALTELDIVGLTPKGKKDLRTLENEWTRTREARAHQLGVEVVRDLVIPSPIGVFGAMMEGYDPYPDDPNMPAFGYSALISRDPQSGNIKKARGIHIPSQEDKSPPHNPNAIQQYREPLLTDQAGPLKIVSRSQDRQLQRNGWGHLPTEPTVEPSFNWIPAGQLPDGTAVDRTTIGSITRPPVNDGRIIVVHSRTLMEAWQYGTDPETYAHLVSPRGMERDPETGQQTQVFDRLTVFSAGTLKRLAKLRTKKKR